jgi:hypothetical protein
MPAKDAGEMQAEGRGRIATGIIIFCGILKLLEKGFVFRSSQSLRGLAFLFALAQSIENR